MLHVYHLILSVGSVWPILPWSHPTWAQQWSPREIFHFNPTLQCRGRLTSLFLKSNVISWPQPQEKTFLIASFPCGSRDQFLLPLSWYGEGRQQRSWEDSRPQKETPQVRDGSQGWPSSLVRCPWHGDIATPSSSSSKDWLVHGNDPARTGP